MSTPRTRRASPATPRRGCWPRPGCTARSASATPRSCQDRHRVRQAAGRYRLTPANWFEVMGDRPTVVTWGHRHPHPAQRLAGHGDRPPCVSSRPRRRRAAGGRFGPTWAGATGGSAAARAVPGRRRHPVGATGARAGDDLPARPHRARRDRGRRRADARDQVVDDIRRRARACAARAPEGAVRPLRHQPRSASWPSRRTNPR